VSVVGHVPLRTSYVVPAEDADGGDLTFFLVIQSFDTLAHLADSDSLAVARLRVCFTYSAASPRGMLDIEG